MCFFCLQISQMYSVNSYTPIHLSISIHTCINNYTITTIFSATKRVYMSFLICRSFFTCVWCCFFFGIVELGEYEHSHILHAQPTFPFASRHFSSISFFVCTLYVVPSFLSLSLSLQRILFVNVFAVVVINFSLFFCFFVLFHSLALTLYILLVKFNCCIAPAAE